uniref:Uncharacterized protein n=1 Tax=Physcomitrium patens TaxID=3218 RepID=A0A2K1ICV3_PHYPA|nr:hypothetical protein PHYPA_030585 [Physcomitrium patens]
MTIYISMRAQQYTHTDFSWPQLLHSVASRLEQVLAELRGWEQKLGQPPVEGTLEHPLEPTREYQLLVESQLGELVKSLEHPLEPTRECQLREDTQWGESAKSLERSSGRSSELPRGTKNSLLLLCAQT